MTQELREVYVKFSEAIWGINTCVVRIVAENQDLNQYSEQQLQTLRVIKQHPNISQIEIASYQGVFKTAISNRIRKLEQDGLVFIRPDKDMRKKVVSLTSKGMQLMETAEKAIYGKLNELLGSEFSKEEILTFVGQLDRAVHCLNSKKEVEK